MFALQAAIFYFPFKLWKNFEGGLMASFGTDGKSPVMITEDAMYDDGIVMEAVIEKFVKYFKSIFHHNSWYLASFIFCKLWTTPILTLFQTLLIGECLNFGLLFLQFFATDLFLNRKFWTYGLDVVHYYSYSKAQRNDPELALR